MRSSGASLSASDVWTFLNSFVQLMIDGGLMSGNIGVWGAWDQLVASSTADIFYLLIGMHEPDAGTLGVSIQIGIGAGGSEVAKFQTGIGDPNDATDIGLGGQSNGPCFIPAGSRISARIRNEGGNNNTCRFNIVGMLNS